jgi:hypothetical protein
MGMFDHFNPVKIISDVITKPAELIAKPLASIPVIGKPLGKLGVSATHLVADGVKAIPKTFHNVDLLMHGRDPISGEKYTNIGGVIRGQFKFSNHMDHMYESLGLKSGRMKKVEQEEQNARAEVDNRSNAYNAALNDNTLDEQTKAEITAAYNGGADSAKISALLNSARAGEGVYGKRQVIAAEQNYYQQKPGRRQLLGTSGYGSLL